MKKLLALLLVCVMAISFAACGKTATAPVTDNNGENADAVQSDLAYIKEKGTLVVGITDFEPMDNKDEQGNWIGFDADLAAAFAESLGVKVEFAEIEWGNKILELNGKSIDCVWNGMTLTDEVTSSMDCSKPYCNNQQVVVVPAAKAADYQTADSCKELNFAVEEGSAGEDMAKENSFNYTAVKDQATAVMEVASGTSDAAIIDSLMAAAMVGEGTGYESLTYTVGLNSEEYGVGFRKGSELKDMLDKFLDETKESGKLEEIAEKYGVQAALIK